MEETVKQIKIDTQLYKNIELFAASMTDKEGEGMLSCCWLGV